MKRSLFSISRYDNPRDLFMENGMEMTQDQSDFFFCVNDYEPVAFYLINGDTVVTVDTISDEVMGEDSLDDFYAQSIIHYLESQS